MEILSDIGALGDVAGPVSLALGVFDGVHRGHAEVVRRAAGWPATLVVATFDPHPVRILRPDRAPKLLTPLEHKARLLGALGVDHLMAIPFDRERSHQDAEDFVRELAGTASVVGISVGEGFRFGHERSGDLALLSALGDEIGFEVVGIPPVTDSGGDVISSTRIRSALCQGDLSEASRLLGRPFSVFGHVAHGAGVGQGIGFPTANVASFAEALPPNGVYAVKGTVDGTAFRGVANLGLRPTVSHLDEGRPLLEVHLFDFDRDVYGAEIEVEFVANIRDERKFDGIEALRAQIGRDVEAARALLC